ncbi:unnamed protein product [Paramecium primaurelia]|uniref:VWFA domain-containing protein n=1 Tax=Paramecium primaurelia TaxID=5886 RepID=A0A8S1M1P7_PARPR|nr:unnamed protein product [Paramecium primaurelia]
MKKQKQRKGRSISNSDSSQERLLDQLFFQRQIHNIPKNQDQNYLLREDQAIEIEDQVFEQQKDIKESENFDIDAKKEEYKNTIQLNIFPRQNEIQLKDYCQILPVVVQLQSIKASIQQARANLDLICVIDVSGSMEGEKLKLVQNSIKYIQKILKPNDRIALVTFASQAFINLSWTRNIPKNKDKIKKAINNMKIRDSTKIALGFELGLRMIRDRKYKNQVTSMFLLSDGVDDDKGADQRCKSALIEYKIKDIFTINTFGYGADHDPKVMNNISNLKGGQFIFIDNFQQVSERFILAISGMSSIKAQNAVLNLKQLNEHFKINKIFGDDILWQKVNETEFQLNLNYIIQQDQKEFALEIEIPQKNTQVTDIADILLVTLQGLLIEINSEFSKEVKLTLQFSNQQVIVEPNQLVEVNYLRGKAGDIIGQAKEYANQRKYDQAQQLLNKMIDEIEGSSFQNEKQLLLVIKDLTTIKAICQPRQYEKGGEALMLHKQKKHIKRQRSISNSEEWCSSEELQMNNLRNGNLDLSVGLKSSDSASSRRSYSLSPGSDYSRRKPNKNRQRRRYRSRSRSSDSGSQRRRKPRNQKKRKLKNQSESSSDPFSKYQGFQQFNSRKKSRSRS